MNNISDKNVILVLFGTVIVVFVLIFSVKSPERKIIRNPSLKKTYRRVRSMRGKSN